MAPRRVGLSVVLLSVLGGAACVQPPLPNAACPSPVAWQDAGQHVGQLVQVRGPVSAAQYLPDADGQPTILDLGAAFPNQSRFSVIIWGRDRARFATPPEQAYLNRVVCVTGVISTDYGSPGTEISSPTRVVVN